MKPTVQITSNKGDEVKFTMSNVNVSIANSIRRTILSDIPTVVFKTAPYEENKANIIANTSRLNNEIIKQRLSCIPIHVKEIDS
jgi:DNA-directed RNA polymerase II subunit RPB3